MFVNLLLTFKHVAFVENQEYTLGLVLGVLLNNLAQFRLAFQITVEGVQHNDYEVSYIQKTFAQISYTLGILLPLLYGHSVNQLDSLSCRAPLE